MTTNIVINRHFISILQMKLTKSLGFNDCHSIGDAVINVVEQETKHAVRECGEKS